MTDLCGCMRCYAERQIADHTFWPKPGFRYACEVCGNKRCPHHTDHELPCTGSNKPGQRGSAYE